MQNTLERFSFNDQEIRVVERNNNVWFIANDICKIIGITNTSRAISRLKPYEKDIITGNTLGGLQEMLIVSEPGLYRLIITSRKPEAEAFQDWICQKVIPSIRKTGIHSISKASYGEALVNQAQAILELERKQLEATLKSEEAFDISLKALQACKEIQQQLKPTTLQIKLDELQQLAQVVKSNSSIQTDRQLLNDFVQRLASYMCEAYGNSIKRTIPEIWKYLGLKLRNSAYSYDLNSRFARARRRYERALEDYKSGVELNCKPVAPNRCTILEKSNMLKPALECCLLLYEELIN